MLEFKLYSKTQWFKSDRDTFADALDLLNVPEVHAVCLNNVYFWQVFDVERDWVVTYKGQIYEEGSYQGGVKRFAEMVGI